MDETKKELREESLRLNACDPGIYLSMKTVRGNEPCCKREERKTEAAATITAGHEGTFW